MSKVLSRAPALVLGAALAAVAAACDAERATAPPAEELAAIEPRLVQVFTEGLNASLQDAATRLAPALGDEGGAQELRDHLESMARHLAAGDAAGSAAALRRANEVLARSAATPDAGAIGLVLDYTAALLADVRR